MCPGHMDNRLGAPDMPQLIYLLENGHRKDGSIKDGNIKDGSIKDVVMAKTTFFLQELKTISVPNHKKEKEKYK
ncbi:hypothetical protein CBFG_01975 [Clostridiales bacterium 1_7_47FAA]|nr:hypothetical protein CBFG_01975 [Clostridiales bacterium 1_7_47FAA]